MSTPVPNWLTEEQEDKNKTINRRLFILGSAKVGLLGLITSKLYTLQISEKTKYNYSR